MKRGSIHDNQQYMPAKPIRVSQNGFVFFHIKDWFFDLPKINREGVREVQLSDAKLKKVSSYH